MNLFDRRMIPVMVAVDTDPDDKEEPTITQVPATAEPQETAVPATPEPATPEPPSQDTGTEEETEPQIQ